MSEALDKAYQTQIANIEKNTGKKLDEWISIIHASGKEKHGEMVGFLKEHHGFTHGNANMIVHYANQSHAAAATDQEDLVTGQYQGKENLRPLYDLLMQKIADFGSDIEVSPKKAYVSLRRKKQFAIIQPSTKTRLDVGLNIKNEKAAGKLEAAGSWNSMCTHRVKVESAADITPELIHSLQKAYSQAG